jgi:hypothetical protein
MLFSHIERLEPRRLLASVGGIIFDDVNHNGILDSPDLGISGRVAYLDLNSNNTFDGGEPSATSNRSGRFYIPNDGVPNSTVRQVLPSGWTASGPTSYSVPGGLSSYDKDFGAYPTGSTIPTGSIVVSAFKDANGNGLRDAGETASSGQRIFLDYANDGYTDEDRQLTTDAQGNVQFTNVRPGTYVVRMSYPSSGDSQSAPSDDGPLTVTVNTGPANAGSFGVASNSYFSRISGVVFEDKNENGIQEAGENSLSPGHTVYIDTNNNGLMDATERRMTTFVDGYWFYSVRPGTYTLRVIPAAGWHQTFPANNGARIVTTQAGDDSVRQDFGATNGEVPPKILSTNLFFNRSAPPFMEINFSEDIGKSIFSSDAKFHNLDSGEQFPLAISYNPGTYKATIRLPQTTLTDGNYNLTLQPGDVKDLRGNSMAAPYSYDFFILKGDLNRDRSVSISDFITLSSNFNKPGLPSTGDLNDDGQVTISDYIDLAANFGKTLPPPDPTLATIAMAPASSTITQTSLAAAIAPKKHRNRHHIRPGGLSLA